MTDRRGFFGIGIFQPKKSCNMGTLLRTAHAFGASLAFTIGARYKRQASDTTDARRHMPLFEFQDIDEAFKNLPYSCMLVGVELDDRAKSIRTFCHPDRAIYLLGAEDHGLPDQVRQKCHCIVQIPGDYCLNVSVAGSIVLYDRIAKRGDVPV